MTNPFLDAVKAVPHHEACPSFPLAGAPGQGMGFCNCDRDERIAKGLLEALLIARRGGRHPSNADAEIAAFTEASP